MVNKNKTQITIMAMLVVTFGLALIASGYTVNRDSDKKSAIPAHELLSEISQASRFHLTYHLENVPYGNEDSFQNDAWQQFLSRYGTGWRIMWDSKTQRPNLIEGKGIPFYPGRGNTMRWEEQKEITVAFLHDRIIAFTAQNHGLMRLDFAKLRLNTEGSMVFENGRYAIIQYDYYLKEIMVRGARAFFRFNNGNLIQFGTLSLSDADVSVTPSIPGSLAEQNVKTAFTTAVRTVSKTTNAGLFIVPELPADSGMLSHRLVWIVQYEMTNPADSWEAWVDAQSGKILYYYTMTESGDVYGIIKIRPTDARNKSIPYCTVENNTTKNTTFWGYYTYTNSPSTTASTTLGGEYFTINDTCGAFSLSTSTSPGDLVLYSGVGIGTDCSTPGYGGAGNTWSSRSMFWHANLLRAKAKYYLPTVTWLDSTVTINNNRTDDSCNAFWSGGTLNFFQSTVDCANTGEIMEIMDHEYGHGLDANDGGPAKTPAGERTSGEASGDFFGALFSKNACAGLGFYLSAHCHNCPTTCSGIRYLAMRFDDDNNPGTPDVPVRLSNITNDNGPDCDYWACPYTDYQGIMGFEGHCESYIAGGAVWDMVQNIVTARGEDGWTWTDRIWFESFPSFGSAYQRVSGAICNTSATIDGCAATNWYTVLLGADDDDGNLTNGTPNGGRIWTAFNDHGIACGSQPANYNVCVEPSTPTLYIAQSDREVGLIWTPSTNATGYIVYESEFPAIAGCNAGGWRPYAQLGDYNYQNIYNMHNLIDHSFVVQAINGSTDCVSPMSNCAWATPDSTPLVNLAGIKYSGWDYVLVPSNNTCDSTNCARSATLSANGTTSYVNFKIINNSSENAGAHNNALYVDDELNVAVSETSHNANTARSTLNLGVSIKGGRHMLKLGIDAYNDLTESIEEDNIWVAPFAVYEPYDLDTDTDHLIVRTAPPDRDPQGYNFYSCDGYHFSVIPTGDDQNWWGAVAVLPATSTSDYDIRLYDDYADSTHGFGSNLKWATLGGNGEVDILGVNRNNYPTASLWAGIIQGSTTPTYADYAVHSDGSAYARQVPSTGTGGTIPGNGVVSIEEIHFGAEDLATTWRFTVTPDGGDIGIALIGSTAQLFILAEALPGTRVNNGGSNVAEYFDFAPTASGYYALLIYKPDYSERLYTIDYDLDIEASPSNLRPILSSGWTAEVVPRDSAGCSLSSCLVSATLPGWTGTTYVNSTSTNDGPNNITTAFSSAYSIDNSNVDFVSFASLPVGNIALDTNNALTSTVKGGRHTLGINVDYMNDYPESNETDNTAYHQYVWSPRALTDGSYINSGFPPMRTTPGATAFNCDGYQFSLAKDWSIASVVPNGISYNYDIRLHNDYTGSTAGFSTVLEWSLAGTSLTDFILVNKAAGIGPWYAGVIQGTDSVHSGNYTIGYRENQPTVGAPGNFGPYTIPINSIAVPHPIVISVASTFTITLDITGGTADLAMAIYNTTDNYHDVNEYIAGGYSNSGGAGVDETFTITLSTGTYVIVIFKADWTAVNAATPTTYYLRILSSGIAETPDNNIIPGIPLTIAKESATQLHLTWGHSCDYVPAYTHYAIYGGKISELQKGIYDYQPTLCDSGMDNTEIINGPPESYYYVIVPTNNTNEGGYGFRSNGTSRPVSASPCYPQNRISCP